MADKLHPVVAMYPIAIGLAIRNNALWSDVTSTLRNLPFRVVFDHPEVENRQGLLDRIERGAPDVVLLECTNKTDVLEELMAAIRATGPAPLVIALHASPELEGAVIALRAGVMEFLYPPIRENLLKALERAQQQVHRRPPGKVFGILSAKGGCGATTVACHTAVAIAERVRRDGKQTVLIDLDLNTGMVRFLDADLVAIFGIGCGEQSAAAGHRLLEGVDVERRARAGCDRGAGRPGIEASTEP